SLPLDSDCRRCKRSQESSDYQVEYGCRRTVQRSSQAFSCRIDGRMSRVVTRALDRPELSFRNFVHVLRIWSDPRKSGEDSSIVDRLRKFLTSCPWIRNERVEVKPLGQFRGSSWIVSQDTI